MTVEETAFVMLAVAVTFFVCVTVFGSLAAVVLNVEEASFVVSGVQLRPVSSNVLFVKRDRSDIRAWLCS